MNALAYVVPGRPVTWARTNVVHGKPTTDKAQRAAKRAHQLAALAAFKGARATWSLAGAFEVFVTGYWPDAKVGDSDRLVGVAMDALQGLLYTSDRQVRRQTGSVVADGSPERVEVLVRRMESDPVRTAKQTRKRKAASLAPRSSLLPHPANEGRGKR